ncbi:hypothetical protein AMJ48_00610 [Parcubacteria bacterium DG_74_1]|nr:MAG: hypothetical protein AMJ48_00610 [Parcubacteria bacterium DG_74_1]
MVADKLFMWEELYKYLIQTPVSYPLCALGAFLFFLIGWVVSQWLGERAADFLGRIRLNQILKGMGVEESLSKIDTRLNAPRFFGEIVRWFFVLLFLTIAAEVLSARILGLTSLSQFLWRVIDYYPNIFIAILIFLVAVFLADFSQKIVVGTLKKEKITYSRFSGKAIRWTIWLFAILAILYQLKITPSLILVIFIGVVITISIALGLSFGLGGKDLAGKILKELEEKFK